MGSNDNDDELNNAYVNGVREDDIIDGSTDDVTDNFVIDEINTYVKVDDVHWVERPMQNELKCVYF